MENSKLIKKYFNKYLKEQYIKEDDNEFKALVKILNDKDRQVKNCSIPAVKSRLRWLDEEKERPKAKQEIIFIDAVGMYKGTFSTIAVDAKMTYGND